MLLLKSISYKNHHTLNIPERKHPLKTIQCVYVTSPVTMFKLIGL